jgi:multiple sugar transport system permease protein
VTRRRLGGAAWTAVAAAIVGVYLFPLYWMYVTGLKGNAEIYRSPPSFWPIHPRWSVPAVIRNHGLPHYLFNSLLIASISTVLAVGFGTGAAYVLARRRGALIDAALFAILMVQALPASLLATPMFVAFDQTGLLHLPRLAVALAQTGRVMPFYVVLCRAGFLAVPRELEQAAFVDGASRWQALLLVVIPLARNIILVAAILIFLQSLGEYVYSRSLISSDALQTATVGLRAFLGSDTSDWSGVMTYASVYVTPILIVFVLLQRRIISGLTAGALK